MGLVLAGCGGAAEPPPSPATSTIDVTTGDFQAPPGDSLTCVYTNVVTDHEIYVGNATGKQAPGGHHIIVYYTDTMHPTGHHPCVDAEMLAWHQIAGADQNKEPVLVLPEGAAIKVPAGKQLVIQSHYINTTGATQTYNDSASIQLVDGKDVKQFLNFLAFVDTQFAIPPQATYKSVTTCTIKDDINAVLLLGHMHELGKHYSLERIDDNGASLEMVYDHDWKPSYLSHPPIVTASLDAPIVIKSGTRLRQTCEWNNSTPKLVSFPTEMCVSFMFYFPDNGFVECNGAPEPKP